MRQQLYFFTILALLLSFGLPSQGSDGPGLVGTWTDGTVRGASGGRLGRVESDGTVRGASGHIIGRAQYHDRKVIAAVYFFFFFNQQ